MRVLFAMVLGLMTLGGVHVGAAQEATPAAEMINVARTNLRYFLPYTADGLASDLNVVSDTSGVCLFPSLADVGRPDAWACMEADTSEIFDPCFANPFPESGEVEELACVASPFEPEVIRFTLTEPLQRLKDVSMEDIGAPQLPAADPGADVPGSLDSVPDDSAAEVIEPLEIPWALELANGSRCGLLTGATAVLAGQRINYGCDDGGLIIGEVDRSSPMWSVSYLADGASATDLVEVVTAWT